MFSMKMTLSNDKLNYYAKVLVSPKVNTVGIHHLKNKVGVGVDFEKAHCARAFVEFKNRYIRVLNSNIIKYLVLFSFRFLLKQF